MERRTLLWIVVGAVFLVALFFTFKAGAIGAGSVVQDASSTLSGAVSGGASGMVGGC